MKEWVSTFCTEEVEFMIVPNRTTREARVGNRHEPFIGDRGLAVVAPRCEQFVIIQMAIWTAFVSEGTDVFEKGVTLGAPEFSG